MIFQLKKNRVQCYREVLGDDEKKKRVMVTSIPLGTSPNMIDMNDERNSQLTEQELKQYESWFKQRKLKEQKERDKILEDYKKDLPERVASNIGSLLVDSSNLEEKDQDLLINSAVTVLKTLKPELLEPKMSLKQYIRSLFS